MGANAKPTTIRIDENLKQQASELCDFLGMSYNTYVTMATRQLVSQRRIPFEVTADVHVPNAQTHSAMVAAEAKELGLIPDDALEFSDVSTLMEYLDE